MKHSKIFAILLTILLLLQLVTPAMAVTGDVAVEPISGEAVAFAEPGDGLAFEISQEAGAHEEFVDVFFRMTNVEAQGVSSMTLLFQFDYETLEFMGVSPRVFRDGLTPELHLLYDTIGGEALGVAMPQLRGGNHPRLRMDTMISNLGDFDSSLNGQASILWNGMGADDHISEPELFIALRFRILASAEYGNSLIEGLALTGAGPAGTSNILGTTPGHVDVQRIASFDATEGAFATAPTDVRRVSVPSEVTTYGGLLALAPEAPVHPWTDVFQGWARTEGGDVIEADDETPLTGSPTLFAVWGPPVPMHEVTFVLGRAGVALEDLSAPLVQTVAEGANATPPSIDADTYPEGYVFAGWDRPYTNIQSSIEIHAVWERLVIRVTFDANEGTFDTADLDDTTRFSDVTVGSWYFEAMQNLPEPTRAHAGALDGYFWVFSGWRLADQTVITGETRIPMDAQNHTVFAHWVEVVPPAPGETTIIFRGNGGTLGVDNEDIVIVTEVIVEGDDTIGDHAPSATRAYHSFVAWEMIRIDGSVLEVDEDDLVEDVYDYAIGSVIILTATWTEAPITISFDANEGVWAAGDTAEAIRTAQAMPGNMYAVALAAVPNVTRTHVDAAIGYTWVFDGWFTAQTGGTRILPTDIIDLAAATRVTELFAQWTLVGPPAATYTTIVFQPNGAGQSAIFVENVSFHDTSETPAVPVTFAEQFPAANAFTRPGFEFVGWYTAPTGGQVVTATHTILEIYALDQDSRMIMLYARWEQLPPFSVTFDWDYENYVDVVNNVAPGTNAANIVPGRPTRVGYRHTGWEIYTDTGYEATTLGTVYEATIFRATWEQASETARYVVVFDWNISEDDAHHYPTPNYHVYGVVHGTDAADIAPDWRPGHNNHSFVRWYPDLGAVTADNRVFTAQWELNERNVTVRYIHGYAYDELGEPLINVHDTIPYGRDVRTCLCSNAAWENFERPGFTLVGWEPALGAVTVDTDFHAVWERNPAFDVTFHWLYNDLTATAYNITPGTAFADVVFELELERPVREGHRHVGWYPEVETIYDEAHFDAIWVPVPEQDRYQDVTFIWELYWIGETVITPVEGVLYGSHAEVALEQVNRPAHPGHRLMGWSPALGAVTTENHTFYAQWWTETIERHRVIFEHGHDANENIEFAVLHGTHASEYADDLNFTRVGYTFGGWYPALHTIVGDATFRAIWNPLPLVDITFDWQVADEEIVEYLGMVAGTVALALEPSPRPVNPGQRHTGWTPGLGVVIEDTDFLADWAETVDTHTVVFHWNLVPSVAPHIALDVLHGSDAALVAPTEFPAHPGREFVRWSPGLGAVTETNNVFTAVWQSTTQEHTVTFVHGYGVADVEVSVLHGTHAATVAPAFTRAGFTLTWDEELHVVTGDVTFTAVWVSGEAFNITFDWNTDGVADVVILNVAPGTDASLHEPEASARPVRDTFRFVGWNVALGPVYVETTFIAQWEEVTDPSERYQDVTFSWGTIAGEPFTVEGVLYGSDAALVQPEIADRPDHAGYEFNGWLPNLGAVTSDNNHFVAQWVETSLTHTVTFIHGYGENATETVAHGTHASAVAPTFTRDGHTFGGWSPDLHVVVEDNTTFTAIWVIGNAFDVTFDWQVADAVDTVENVLPGTAFASIEPEASARPVNPGQRHTGWTPPVSVVNAATTFYATWAETVETHTVVFHWNLVPSVAPHIALDVLHGSDAADVAPTEFPAHPELEFRGWYPDLDAVTETNNVFTAQWEITTQTHTVTFVHGYNSAEDYEDYIVGNVEHGTHASTIAPAFTRPGFTLTWDEELHVITGDTTFTAVWVPQTGTFDVTFDWNYAPAGITVVPDVTSGIEFGEIAPERPVRAGWTHLGWTPEVEHVYGESTFVARWEEITDPDDLYVTITFDWNYPELNANTVTETVRYGSDAADVEPSRIAREGHRFMGWEPTLGAVTQWNNHFEAQWEQTPETHTVRFVHGFGTADVVLTAVPHGSDVTAQAPAFTRAGYNFVNWSPEPDIITGDRIFEAVWTSITGDFTVTFDWNYPEAGVNTAVTANVTAGTNAQTLEPTNRPVRAGYRHTGWNLPLGPVFAETTFEATWAPTDARHTVTFDWNVAGVDLVFVGSVPHGSDAALVAPTEFPAHPGQRFMGWQPNLGAVTETNSVFVAQWEPTTDEHEVIFVNPADPTQNVTESVLHGTHANVYAPEWTRAGYVFMGWSPTLHVIVENATFTAIWEEGDTGITIDVDEEGNITIDIQPEDQEREIEIDEDGNIVITLPDREPGDEIIIDLPGDDWGVIIDEDDDGNVIVIITPPDGDEIVGEFPDLILRPQDPDAEISVDVDNDGNVNINVQPEQDEEISIDEDGNIVITLPDREPGDDIEINLPPGWTYTPDVDDDGNVIIIVTPPPGEEVAEYPADSGNLVVQPVMVTVTFATGPNGTIGGGTANVVLQVQHGTTLSAGDIPASAPNANFAFENWAPVAPLGVRVTENITFTVTWAQIPAGPPVGGGGGGGWVPQPPTTTPEPERELHRRYMFGNEQGQFMPHGNLTRAEAATILTRTQLRDFATTTNVLPPGMTSFNVFSDVNQGDWFFFYVAWAHNAGLVQGADGQFRPNDPVTREELAAMIVRTGDVLLTGTAGFGDFGQTSNWARDYVFTAYRERLMQGDEHGNFNPLANIDRASAATAFNRMLNRIDSRTAWDRADILNLQVARHFHDVPASAWFYPSVIAATNDHYISRNNAGNINWMQIVR